MRTVTVMTSERLVEIAMCEIGYKEKASNKYLDDPEANAGKGNYTKYARDLDAIGFYNGKKNGNAWCDIFYDWCMLQACNGDAAEARRMLCQPEKSLGAGCEYSRRYYDYKRQFHGHNEKPEVGDQIFFGADGKATHTGLVYAVEDGYVYTVEGNKGSSNMVSAYKYALTDPKIVGYGRPAFDAFNNTVRNWQIAAQYDGFAFPKYGIDGLWGTECEKVAKKAIVKKRLIGYKYPELTKIVQRTVGVDVDGKCGKNTKAAIIAYQKAHGLDADGEVGLNTWKEILDV